MLDSINRALHLQPVCNVQLAGTPASLVRLCAPCALLEGSGMYHLHHFLIALTALWVPTSPILLRACAFRAQLVVPPLVQARLFAPNVLEEPTLLPMDCPRVSLAHLALTRIRVDS